MPTFFARSTTIQLSAADLRTTTTSDPIIGWSNNFYKDVDRTISEIASASKDGTLAETPLLDPINGSHMRFLGPHGDMPFFMVHAGKAFFDADTNEKRNQKPARAFYQQSSQAPATPASPTLHSSEAMSGVNHEIAANAAQTQGQQKASHPVLVSILMVALLIIS